MPERLVGVDVPEPRDRALVEDRRFHRGLPPGEPACQKGGREPSPERLRTVLDREVPLGCLVIEQQPRAEAPDVAVRDPRSIVELDHRPLVRRGRVAEAAGHAQVDEQGGAALETDEDVLAVPLDRDDPVSLQLRGDEGRIVGSRQPGVVDAHAGEAPAFEAFGESATLGFDLGKLRH